MATEVESSPNEIPQHAQAAADFLRKNGWAEIVNSTMRQHLRSGQVKSNRQRFKQIVRDVQQVTHGARGQENKILLMQIHWLEAIDSKHRYGSCLRPYYEYWHDHSDDSRFFHWLDHGDGKEPFSLESCPREKLENSCIKYLSELERERYAIKIENGLFYYRQSGEKVHSMQDIQHDHQSNEEVDEDEQKFIFVVSPEKVFYAGRKLRGKFHHSSFLAGGATIGAGNLQLDNGVLLSIKPHSGHYMPNADQFQLLLRLLQENGVDMSQVQIGKIKQQKQQKSLNHTFTKKNSVNNLNQENEPGLLQEITLGIKQLSHIDTQHLQELTPVLQRKISQLSDISKDQIINDLIAENIQLQKQVSGTHSQTQQQATQVQLLQLHQKIPESKSDTGNQVNQLSAQTSLSQSNTSFLNSFGKQAIPFVLGLASYFIAKKIFSRTSSKK